MDGETKREIADMKSILARLEPVLVKILDSQDGMKTQMDTMKVQQDAMKVQQDAMKVQLDDVKVQQDAMKVQLNDVKVQLDIVKQQTFDLKLEAAETRGRIIEQSSILQLVIASRIGRKPAA